MRFNGEEQATLMACVITFSLCFLRKRIEILLTSLLGDVVGSIPGRNEHDAATDSRRFNEC